MKVIITGFKYKGRHFDTFEFEMADVDYIDVVSEEEITKTLIQELDRTIEEEGTY